MDAIESHIDGTRALLFDVFVGNATGGGVVNLDWSQRLQPSFMLVSSLTVSALVGDERMRLRMVLLCVVSWLLPR